jgi:predicted permease
MEEAQYSAQAGTALQYNVAARASTDFITDPGIAILLSIITCGIYGLYILYKLVQRRDEHFQRMAAVVDASIAQLRVKAQGREDAIAAELAQLDQIRMRMATLSAERGAVIWLLICIFTSLVGYAILYYLLMQDYVEHDEVESQFFTIMSGALAKLGLSGQAGQAAPSVPRREFVTFLLLTIITCGIYGFYWMYVMIKDFNEHFEAQVPWEDFLLTALA